MAALPELEVDLGRMEGLPSLPAWYESRACGEYFASTKITAIYSSPLVRALTTAQQILEHQASDEKLTLTTSLLLREQHWGDLEGSPITWALRPSTSSSSFTQKADSPLVNRTSKFPNGESSEDVANRASEFISEFIMPHLQRAKACPAADTHIFLVSHGICISELIGAFLRRVSLADDGSSSSMSPPNVWRGLWNTAWTRIVVGLKDEVESALVPKDSQASSEPIEFLSIQDDNAFQVDNATDIATALETTYSPNTDAAAGNTSINPPLTVNIVLVNQHSHTDTIKRQKGGIGSSAFDPNQKSIKDFFGDGSEGSALSSKTGPSKI